MWAEGASTPSLIMAGTSSDTMTMYAGVVGIPMPSTMPARAVSSRARNKELLASSITTCVKTIPKPVIVTQPITRPAHAHAIATESALRAPSSRA